MRISRFSAENYKSIRSLPSTELTSGFNIITGQNASGKTALLELLSLSSGSLPHRSQKTVPNSGDITNSVTAITVSLTVSSSELLRILRNNRESRFIPLPPVSSELAIELRIYEWNAQNIQRFIESFLRQPELTFELTFLNGGPAVPGGKRFSFETYTAEMQSNGNILSGGFTVDLDGKVTGNSMQWVNLQNDPGRDLGVNISPYLRSAIYRFSPERAPRARSPHGVNAHLHPNTANLAEVLDILQSNAAAFEEFVALVSEVFPQVRWLSVRAVSEGNEIGVWSHDRATKREDLAVPLDQTGTGIGQVLAILYVVFSSYESKTIVIDEPQSFLHPASAIKLVEILKRYPQHQFILATHSPSIIAAATPKTILALQFGDDETKLEVFDLHKATSFNAFLKAAGLHLQDVFGADSILWVEGPTEEEVFPAIIERLTDVALMGTTIKAVKATGDLEGRDAKRVFEIYRTLTKGNALLPPALAFILDRETRSDQDQREMIRLSGNTAVFLKRRMFENYLLNPNAIAAVMNSTQGFRDTPIRADEVTAKFEEKTKDKKYFYPLSIQLDWRTEIHASKLLSDIFAELSDNRVSYRKPDHSVLLAKWTLENNSGDLKEVADLLGRAFGKREVAAKAL